MTAGDEGQQAMTSTPPPRAVARPRPLSITISTVVLGLSGLGVLLLGAIGVVLLLQGTEARGVAPPLVVPVCALLAVGHVVAILRLRAGARSGWVLGLVLHLVVAVARTWDSATYGSGRPGFAELLWPTVGCIALLMPASRAYVGIGRPAP